MYEASYLVYQYCPFEYCSSLSPPINLNQPNGPDAQCAFNQSSLLCGSCQPDFSLSLVGPIVIDFNSIDPAVGGHIALERTLSPSISCPNGTLNSSEACPQGHTALGYNVRGDILRGVL